MYFFFNQSYFDALKNGYVRMDNQTMIFLLVGIKKTDSLQTQAKTFICSEYEKAEYPRANGVSV